MSRFLSFQGEPCAIEGHGSRRWRDTGKCTECTTIEAKAARRRGSRLPVRVGAKPEPVERACVAARAAGDLIYQSRVWCMPCGAYPHRIAATQRCMRCHPDEVNAEARAIVARNHGVP